MQYPKPARPQLEGFVRHSLEQKNYFTSYWLSVWICCSQNDICLLWNRRTLLSHVQLVIQHHPYFFFFFFFKPNCWVPSSCCSSAVFYMKHFYWILGFRGLGFFCACWGLCWFFQFVELPWNCNPLICHCCCTRQAPALCRLNNFICHKVIGDSGVGQIQARHFPAHQRVW